VINLSSDLSDNITPVKGNASKNKMFVNQINKDLQKIEQRSVIGRNLINDILTKTGSGSSPGLPLEAKMPKSAGKVGNHYKGN